MHRSPEPHHAAPGARRLFVGVALPDAVRGALDVHLRAALGSKGLPGRRVPPENRHLTLRFLGDTSASRAGEFLDRMSAADLEPCFALEFGGCGAFPRPARASVLWLGIRDGAEPLARLAAAIEVAARQAGFAAEDRPFRAHLTLSRLQPPQDVRALLDTIPPFTERMRVDEATLFRSHLGGGPPRYEVVERFRLTGSV
jgi:RNA 2',3'-cyclic 3'-phosphodiesterase